MVSKEMKIPLSIYNVPTSIILDAIENTIKILKILTILKFVIML